MDTNSPSPVLAAPNVAPVIDAVLVLLIVLLVTMPMLARSFRTDPPAAPSGECRLSFVSQATPRTPLEPRPPLPLRLSR